MSGKPAKRPKHIPQRTCVGCRSVRAKRTLVRLVHRPEGILVDPSGKLAGRGAYLHNSRDCWEKALKGSLAHALRVEFTPRDIEQLRQHMSSLPEIDQEDGDPD